jgi:hypothetical protein
MDDFPARTREFLSSLSRSNRSRSEHWVTSILSHVKIAATDELVRLIEHRDWAAARQRILTHPWDAQFQLDSGNCSTPLHLALLYRAPHEMVTLLLSANPAALHTQDLEGWTPLHVNILYGGEERTTILLIRRGRRAASIHSRFVGSPLHLACRHGSSAEILKELLKVAPEQVRVSSEAGLTPATLLYKSHIRYNSLEDLEKTKCLISKLNLLMAAEEARESLEDLELEKPSLERVICFQFNHADGTDYVRLFLEAYPLDPGTSLALHTAVGFPLKQPI